MKHCPKCNQTKSLPEFKWGRRACLACIKAEGRERYHRIKHTAAHKASVAKYRSENRDFVKQLSKAWREKNLEKIKASQREWRKSHPRVKNPAEQVARRYKLSEAVYLQMLADANGCCNLCGRTCTRALNVDHDHRTGVVRGLLCRKCNMALGLLEDRPELFEAAIKYLQKFMQKAA